MVYGLDNHEEKGKHCTMWTFWGFSMGNIDGKSKIN